MLLDMRRPWDRTLGPVQELVLHLHHDRPSLRPCVSDRHLRHPKSVIGAKPKADGPARKPPCAMNGHRLTVRKAAFNGVAISIHHHIQ